MLRQEDRKIPALQELPEETSSQEMLLQEMLLNLGPQHPSTHGVLRLVLRLSGETIVDCTPVIGYLHRGIEKTLENRPVMGGIRYMDNIDYLSPMLNEIAYAGAVEKLIDIEPPRRAQYIRLLVGELQRIAPATWSRPERISMIWARRRLCSGPSATARASWHCSKPWEAAALT